MKIHISNVFFAFFENPTTPGFWNDFNFGQKFQRALYSTEKL